MRDEFVGYFEPSEKDTARLWKNAIIALDTNVLLGLYRMPEASRKDIIDVLRSVGERIWVPYHVLVEYHSNRLETLRSEYEAAEKMERGFRSAFVQFKGVVTEEKVTKRACWSDVQKKMAEIEEKANELYSIAKQERNNYIAPNQDDGIRDFLESLLAGKVGPRPENQQAVDSAEKIARERYAAGLGPGHLDDKKDGTHLIDGLVYNRQYGDYMVWSGLIDHCRDDGISSVIFVTSDVKDDWWLDTKGKAGKKPQPELVMEMRRVANVRDFGMYTLSTFAATAKTRLKLKVKEQTITDALKAETASVFTRVAKDFYTLSQRSLREKLNSTVSAKPFNDYQHLYERMFGVPAYVNDVGAAGLEFPDDDIPTANAVVSMNAVFDETNRERLEQLIARTTELSVIGSLHVYLTVEPGVISLNRDVFRMRAKELLERHLPLGTRVAFYIGGFTGPDRNEYAFDQI